MSERTPQDVLREAAEAALTDFVYEHGSDFDAAEWPGMAMLRQVLDKAIAEGPDSLRDAGFFDEAAVDYGAIASQDFDVKYPGWVDEPGFQDGLRAAFARRKPAAPDTLSEKPGLDALIADGRKWQEAEAEGHVVTFSATGYGLQHPPSCRPDLIGCDFNRHLASRRKPARSPGRYSMTLNSGKAEYVRLGSADSEGSSHFDPNLPSGAHYADEGRCPVNSSITGQPCLLLFGHPQWSPTRFHRYAQPDE